MANWQRLKPEVLQVLAAVLPTVGINHGNQIPVSLMEPMHHPCVIVPPEQAQGPLPVGVNPAGKEGSLGALGDEMGFGFNRTGGIRLNCKRKPRLLWRESSGLIGKVAHEQVMAVIRQVLGTMAITHQLGRLAGIRVSQIAEFNALFARKFDIPRRDPAKFN